MSEYLGIESLEKGFWEYEREFRELVETNWQRSAEETTLETLIKSRALRYIYDDGHDAYMRQDYAEAVKLFREAAEQGFAMAQHELGYCYSKGYGVPENKAKAVEWYRKAAEQGYSHAQYVLGGCYAFGEGVQQSNTLAFKWFEEAALRGNADAQFFLAKFYEKGLGMRVSDWDRAAFWYLEACLNGNTDAQHKISEVYAQGIAGLTDVTAEEPWNTGLPKCASLGEDAGKKHAVEAFYMAAQEDDRIAQWMLAFCYDNGLGIEKDFQQALFWWKKAASRNYVRAIHKLADCTSDPIWKHLGNPNGQFELGVRLLHGDGVEQSDVLAAKWFREAAWGIGSEPNPEAQFNLAVCYANGIGVEQNVQEAKNWYEKADGKSVQRGSAFASELVRKTLEMVRSAQDLARAKAEFIARIKNPDLAAEFPKEYQEYQALQSLPKGESGLAKRYVGFFFLAMLATGAGVLNMLYGPYLRGTSFFTQIGYGLLCVVYFSAFVVGTSVVMSEEPRGRYAFLLILSLASFIWFCTGKLPIVPTVVPALCGICALALIPVANKRAANAQKAWDYKRDVIDPLTKKLQKQLSEEYEARFGSKPNL